MGCSDKAFLMKWPFSCDLWMKKSQFCRAEEECSSCKPGSMRELAIYPVAPLKISRAFFPFSTTPSSSSNLQQVEAENSVPRGVRNPVALWDTGGHRCTTLLSRKRLGPGLFYQTQRPRGQNNLVSLMTQTNRPFYRTREHGQNMALRVQLICSHYILLFFSGMFSTRLKIVVVQVSLLKNGRSAKTSHRVVSKSGLCLQSQTPVKVLRIDFNQ